MKDEHNLPTAYKRIKNIKKQIENEEIKIKITKPKDAKESKESKGKKSKKDE